MYTLNITIKVEDKILDAWLSWLREKQIPAVMNSACFTEWRLHRLLGHDEEDSQTFVLQFVAPSIEKYNEFLATADAGLRNASFAKWGQKALEFRTVLEKIS